MIIAMPRAMMMKMRLGLAAMLTAFLALVSYGQDYTKADQMVRSYPQTFASPDALAQRLAADFKTEPEQVRGLFTWIAHNIDYDMVLYREIMRGTKVAFWYKDEADRKKQERRFTADLAVKTLRTRKAVCQGYTALFRTVCGKLGIDCIDISGTARNTVQQIGRIPVNGNHVWSGVKVDGDWKLLDVTWAAGHVDEKGKFARRFNDRYFFTPPEKFFLNHFPEDERLAETVATPKEFALQPLYYSTYLQADCELVSPRTGILKTERPVLIPFRFTGIPEDARLGYCFEGEKYLNPVAVSRHDGETYFEVPLHPGQKGYLTVYLNNRSLIAYKIGR